MNEENDLQRNIWYVRRNSEQNNCRHTYRCRQAVDVQLLIIIIKPKSKGRKVRVKTVQRSETWSKKKKLVFSSAFHSLTWCSWQYSFKHHVYIFKIKTFISSPALFTKVIIRGTHKYRGFQKLQNMRIKVACLLLINHKMR